MNQDIQVQLIKMALEDKIRMGKRRCNLAVRERCELSLKFIVKF